MYGKETIVLENLKEIVCKANQQLPLYGLVTFTWGNVSGIDREKGLVVIKPSGIGYGEMSPRDMVVLELGTGKIIEGQYKPSSDTPTHLELYRTDPKIGGIVHTHSTWATAWAQAGRDIPVYGTTHADTFYGSIPCTRRMSPAEISEEYELNTGKVITETVRSKQSEQIPAALVHSHGPFVWGGSPDEAVHNTVVLEEIAKMAFLTESLNPEQVPVQQELLDKHFLRKHGPNAYYGQK